jgi:hypothetical protein
LNYPFFIKLIKLLKLTKKGETTMGTKRSVWILFGILLISAWVLGSAIQAGAETMKCRTASVYTKVDTIQVSDAEGGTLSTGTTEGLAFCENGEIADFKAIFIADRTTGKDWQSIGYNYFIFEDGSKVITKFDQRNTVDSSGKFSSKSTGEIVKGTGRFEGIKGTESNIGIKVPDVKGGSRKSARDRTLTYTLPSK